MSEISPPVASTLPEPLPAVWMIERPNQRVWLHVLLLVLTLFSTMVVGAGMQFNYLHSHPVFSLNDDSPSLFPIGWIFSQPTNLLLGLPFSLTLMFILLAHEMGHYLYARYYRVYVTMPFFVPFPSLIGTLGAFIRIKSPIPSRRALFDIGIAGPVAGFIPACGALLYGLSLSRPLAAGTTQTIELGFPLAFRVASHILNLGIPLGGLSLHPIAAAAWVGMFATALNLLPGGQLDGGHILFSISPNLHRGVSFVTAVALVPLAKYYWTGWLLWAVLLAITVRHPQVPPDPSVSGSRRWVAVFAIIMLVLSFTPAPFTHASGKEVWPELRDDARDSVRELRNQIQTWMHRK